MEFICIHNKLLFWRHCEIIGWRNWKAFLLNFLLSEANTSMARCKTSKTLVKAFFFKQCIAFCAVLYVISVVNFTVWQV